MAKLLRLDHFTRVLADKIFCVSILVGESKTIPVSDEEEVSGEDLFVKTGTFCQCLFLGFTQPEPGRACQEALKG